MKFIRTPRLFGWQFQFSVSPPTDLHDQYRIYGFVNGREFIEELGQTSRSRALDSFKLRACELASVFDLQMTLGLQYLDFDLQKWESVTFGKVVVVQTAVFVED